VLLEAHVSSCATLLTLRYLRRFLIDNDFAALRSQFVAKTTVKFIMTDIHARKARKDLC